MRRRDFLTALGSTAFLAKANAQQPRPVIGFLHQGALPLPSLKAAFRKGLVEVGISDGPDILIEDRAADGKYDQLPALAADLVNRQVAVMAAELLPAALAARPLLSRSRSFSSAAVIRSGQVWCRALTGPRVTSPALHSCSLDWEQRIWSCRASWCHKPR